MGFPVQFLIPIVGIIFGTSLAAVLLYPIVRAHARRLEHQRGQGSREAQSLPPDVGARLARIEAAVESIAIEVERISEGQRFLTKLQSEKSLPSRSEPQR